MSLFGTSPDNETQAETQTPTHTQSHPPMAAAAVATKPSLFADDPAATLNGSLSPSLFADDAAGAVDRGEALSPWSGSPAPKRMARRDLVKGLLPSSEVPDSYADAFDVLQAQGVSGNGGVGIDTVKKVLASTALGEAEQNTVLDLVCPAGQDATRELGRGEFNVLLALIGLAQEHEESLSLDAVDERRKSMFIVIVASATLPTFLGMISFSCGFVWGFYVSDAAH